MFVRAHIKNDCNTFHEFANDLYCPSEPEEK